MAASLSGEQAAWRTGRLANRPSGEQAALTPQLGLGAPCWKRSSSVKSSTGLPGRARSRARPDRETGPHCPAGVRSTPSSDGRSRPRAAWCPWRSSPAPSSGAGTCTGAPPFTGGVRQSRRRTERHLSAGGRMRQPDAHGSNEDGVACRRLPLGSVGRGLCRRRFFRGGGFGPAGCRGAPIRSSQVRCGVIG